MSFLREISHQISDSFYVIEVEYRNEEHRKLQEDSASSLMIDTYGKKFLWLLGGTD